MRRSICFTEPSAALAGQVGIWKFSYSPAAALPQGTRLKFDLLPKGLPADWQIPQTNPKVKKNLIWGELPSGKMVEATAVESIEHPYPAFEFVLPTELKAGDPFTICIGTPEGKEIEKSGNQAQTLVQRRRSFNLYIDPKGKRDYKEPEVFSVDVRGNKLETIRILAPSMVSKNKRFDVLVRFEDEFGNLTNKAPEDTLIELSYEHLRENLTWKLFVPETGFIVLPNLYFNEPGVYRIQLLNMQSKAKFFSSPIKCFPETEKNLYWGLLHGESERIDASINIESCLKHVRDEKSLQFFATSPFEDAEETSNDLWKAISQQVAEYNEDNRFTALLGFQWSGEPKEEGLRHFIYWKDNKALLRKKDAKSNTLKKIYKTHTPKELLSIPSFTMAKGYEYTFDEYTPEYERVVEIYNAWGSSECTKKEGNLRPITTENSHGVQETEKGSVRAALSRNMRFGFVAGGLDDRGIYSPFHDNDQVQYSPGLTAILAIEQTRDALLLGLYNRSCYATTGPRIVLGYSIAGAQMGSELSTKVKPGLEFNRHITGFVCGTAPLKEVTFIRNGQEFKTFHPKESNFEFVFDDSESLAAFAFNSPDERPQFVYYYMR
ncbi:MAG TPA: DUF3604 domain-containing protein, partial [Rhabdochlamydiaceae bacterium]|nr:DUF3604 domain-containing protein [Rhabdochlamydiaceae bacterium]